MHEHVARLAATGNSFAIFLLQLKDSRLPSIQRTSVVPASPRRRQRQTRLCHVSCVARFYLGSILWLECGGRPESSRATLSLDVHTIRLAMQKSWIISRQAPLEHCSGRLLELQTSLNRCLEHTSNKTHIHTHEYFSQDASVACPIIASQLSIPKQAATHNVADYLSSDMAEMFGKVPLREEPELPMPKAFLNASMPEWRATLRKAARASMVRLAKGQSFDPAESAGAFARVKPSGKQRLICDRRPRNSKELLLGHVDLPSAARFSRLLIPSSHAGVLSLRDLKDMYFIFGVPESRMQHQAWGPRVPGSWFHDLDNVECDDHTCEGDWWEPDLQSNSTAIPPLDYVQPLAAVLLMGDLNAVYIAQHANMGILDKHQALPHGHILTGRGKFPRGSVAKAMAAESDLHLEEDFCLGVYIDDVGCMAVVPWSKLNKPNVASEIISHVDTAYEKENIPQSLEKSITNAFRGSIWGGHFDGVAGTIQAAPEKRAHLALLTAIAIQQPLSGRLLASLLGNWSCHFQYRRPGYSIFSSVYKQQQSIPLDRPRALDDWSQSELLCAACVAPGLVTDVRAKIHSTLFATDASSTAGGITQAALPPWMKIILYDLAEGGGAHVRLDQPAILSDVDLVQGDLVALLTIPLRWQVVSGFDFKHPAHINILEAIALLTCVFRLAKSGLHSRRVIILIDSGVVKGAATKGRSSSRQLNHVLRKIAGLLFAHDLYLELLWIPSKANSSDAPSRHTDLREWQAESWKLWLELLRKFETCPEWKELFPSVVSLLAPNKQSYLCATFHPHTTIQTTNNITIVHKTKILTPKPISHPKPLKNANQGPANSTFPYNSLPPFNNVAPSASPLTSPANVPPPPLSNFATQSINTSKCKLPSHMRMGVAELFSGEGLLSAELRHRRFRVWTYELYGVDGSVRVECDLSILCNVVSLVNAIASKKLRYVHLGTPCSSFSILQKLFNKGTRTSKRPQGDGTNDKERHGNLLVKHSLIIIRACIQYGAFWSLENPKSSYLFKMPGIVRVLRMSATQVVQVDQCMYGLHDPVSLDKYRKATIFIGNLPSLFLLSYKCDGSHVHEPVIGKVKHNGCWLSRSALAGAYPIHLCKTLANIVSVDLLCAHHARDVRLSGGSRQACLVQTLLRWWEVPVF